MTDLKAMQLGQRISAAQEKLLAHLRRHYPRGSRVGVKLSDRQVTLSEGTIVGHDATQYGGEVRVRLDHAKPFSRYMVRSIPLQMVYDVYARPATPEAGDALVAEAERRQMRRAR